MSAAKAASVATTSLTPPSSWSATNDESPPEAGSPHATTWLGSGFELGLGLGLGLGFGLGFGFGLGVVRVDLAP